MTNIFYVYEHWRPDLEIPFYVGKGCKDRYDPTRTRNKHHTNIKLKLRSNGMCVEVKMIASGLTEEEAIKLEIERIAFWRENGVNLTNATAGGDGLRSPTEETRQKMRDAAKKRWAKKEEREKMSIATKLGMSAPEVKIKLSKAFTGREVSLETRKKMSESHKKRFAKAHGDLL
jgi:Zn ribbon nucleic-acid-binding protein